jgi:hypothetical protein
MADPKQLEALMDVFKDMPLKTFKTVVSQLVEQATTPDHLAKNLFQAWTIAQAGILAK